jgi:hypothetical protein
MAGNEIAHEKVSERKFADLKGMAEAKNGCGLLAATQGMSLKDFRAVFDKMDTATHGNVFGHFEQARPGRAAELDIASGGVNIMFRQFDAAGQAIEEQKGCLAHTRPES